MRKKVIFLTILVLAALILTPFFHKLHAQSDDERKSALEKQIQEYQAKLNSLREQRNSLSSSIQYMDTQIYLTGLRIQDTEQKINQTGKEIDMLTSRIGGLDTSLDYLSKLLIQRVVNGYKNKSITVLDVIFDTDNAGDLINKLKYYKTIEQNNQKVLIQVQEAKLNFEEQKQLREKKKVQLDELTKSLESQKLSLNDQKSQKQKLLAETQNDESTYQKLLSQARAQLSGFTRFVNSQGGASLLNNQTVCDDWGCYYNQRDSQWGGNSLNGTGYTLAGEGCLVTSMAMIYTHFGHRSVDPQTINSNSSNFASYYPAYLLFSIVADGASSSRITAAIDGELSSGNPVVVGISYDNGPLPDHFLVLISGSGGNYQMNDPFTANGHNIPFTSHYSVDSIRTVQKVVF